MTVTLLWQCNKLIVTQQELLRYYGNAIWCIDHVTKANLICHIIYIFVNHRFNPEDDNFIFAETLKVLNNISGLSAKDEVKQYMI
jgi:hypothetical protein